MINLKDGTKSELTIKSEIYLCLFRLNVCPEKIPG